MKLKLYQKIILLLLGFIIFVAWIESETRYVVKGRVVEASTGRPIEGASVAITWYGTHFIEMFIPYASGSYRIEEARATTDKEGYFEIPKYFLKRFYMGVYKKGYVCWSSDSVFFKGLDIKEKRDQIKKRIWFRVHSGMTIKLENFTEEYPRFRHASFIDAVSGATGGLEGTGEEIKYYYEVIKGMRNE